MKKGIVVCLAVFMCFSLLTVSFAQQTRGEYSDRFSLQWATAKTVNFEGTVLSHDTACHCIVVKTATGELVLQDDYASFDQEYNRLKGLKIGSVIKGQYKTVNYINYATVVGYK
jgi:hypothetical protein